MTKLAGILAVVLLASPALATVTGSVIVEDAPQIDGRRHVTERHTHHTGDVTEIRYMAAAGADVNAIMLGRVAAVEADMKRNEIASNVANAMGDAAPAPTFLYSTAADFSAALRVEYKAAKGRSAYRIGWYINSFNLTDTQLRNLFGITVGQTAAVRAKIVDYAARYDAMTGAAGD